jgi:hypothetical protein
MSAVSGQYATAKIGSDCVKECDGWSLNRECIVHEYATCETPTSGTAALAGRRKHSGTLKGILDPADSVDAQFEEGDTITLKLYVTASIYYQGEAVIESVNIEEVDITEGGPIRWSASFKANGLFAIPA